MRCRRVAMAGALLVAALLCCFGGVSASEKLGWEEDYRSVMRAAEKQQKLIMIDFYTSWCKFCRQLDEESFEGDERIVELLERDFVVARLDADIQKAATRRYRPEGYPTVIFATPEGEEIARFSGYRKPDQVYEIVKTVSSVGPKVAELYAELEEDERSFELHRELGTIYAELGVAGKACHHLERARRSAPNQQAAAEVAFLRARARLTAGDCDIAEDILKDLIEEAGDGEAPAAWREALEQARTGCAEEG